MTMKLAQTLALNTNYIQVKFSLSYASTKLTS